MLLEVWELASWGIGLVTLAAFWRATLHAWRVLVRRGYWSVPLRALHAYACLAVHFLVWGALDTRLEISRYHAHDPEQVAWAWGQHFFAWAIYALVIWPVFAVVTGLFVFASRPEAVHLRRRTP